MTPRAYHHGDLHRAVLDAAVQAVLEVGPSQLSLRDLARRAGVSHAAPAYHFGNKAGLLTTLAAEGFRMLAEHLTEVLERTGSFLEVGVAYVHFAVEHRAHTQVMFRPDLYEASRADVVEARAAATEALTRGIGTLPPEVVGPDPKVAALAAWSLVHGFADLWLGGALTEAESGDLTASAQAVARFLFDRGTAR
ncbi:TetR/AcrR family transcriptional regulator [Kocuria turfanensis]|uniref:TetR/AcrR family transcriptional regulator n=1 Tax=Kocuria turfanensis TaxID=388357 RepID=UPI0040355344